MSPVNSKNAKKMYKITFLPFDTSIDVPSGTIILDAVRQSDLPLKATCGGEGTCGDCILHVVSGTYQCKPSAVLSERLIKRGYALACLTEVHDDLTVRLPQFQQLSIKSVIDSKFFDEHKNDLSGVYEINPIVTMIDLQLPSPTVDDNYSDLKRVERELQKKHQIGEVTCEYSVLKTLAHAVREQEGQISTILFKSDQYWSIVDVRPQTKGKRIYGVACDIGTTTVSVHLVDLRDGKILKTASSYNQQIKCGEDIISRINYAQKSGRLQELHSLIVTTINQLIDKIVQEIRISHSDIYYASVSGNTTMIHLLLNLDPRYIREEPYVPTLNRVPFISSRPLGLEMNEEGKVHCAPAVGSYVGGDITAGLLCTPMMRDSETISLFIDIGTNGELVVGNRDWLITCACSAGPAFEGSGIKCGMPATEGAIEKVQLKKNGEPEYNVIGDSKPKGLCGSGLIDLLAELFIHGYIDRHGKFNERKAKERIVETDAGRAFLIEEGKKCYWERDLTITQNDITNLIRTKGAVFSACSLLLKNTGLTNDKIEAVYIAGGFGQHLNIEKAIRIGLLPDLERDKFHYLGNSSLLGAYLILLSDKNRELLNSIVEKITYIELNTEPGYMNEYTGALFLPHTDMDLFPSVKKMLTPHPDEHR